MSYKIEKQIELNAPITRVWDALTDYRQFGEWFKVILDENFIPGQVSKGKLNFPGFDNIAFEITVKKMDQERLFSYTWHPFAINPNIDYSKEEPTLVEFKLEKTATGTRLTVTESGFEKIPSNRRLEAFHMNEEGWAIQMGNIEKYITSKR